MKKRTMEKENQAEERRKKILMEIAGTVVVLTVIVSIGLSHLDQTGDLIRTAAELKPEVLFLALGLNDISGTDGDTDAFIEKYKAVLANVREQMPDAVLYINCVLPVSAQKEEEEPVYAKIPDYNTALKAMCDEEGITFIDNTEIVKDEYYEQDGEHMKAEYYPIWAEHMAEVAGI